MIKVCEECGKEFETNLSRARWCNDVHTRTCIICGREFEMTRTALVGDTKCCSRECAQKYARQAQVDKLQSTVRYCKECGKPFTPSNNNQHYCEDIHYRPCPICGKSVAVTEYGDLKSGKCRTCSPECYSKLLSIKSSETHPKSEPKYGTCVVCGKQFLLKHPYNQKTCSSRCRGIYCKESGISKAASKKSKDTLQ